MAKINITVSGTTYDGDLDLAGDSGFQSLITELKSLKSALSAKGKPSGAAGSSIDITRTQKALDTLSDSATDAAKSLDGLGKAASNAGNAFNQSASQAASMGSSMSAVSNATQGLNGSLAQMSGMLGNTGDSLAQMSGMLGNTGGSLAQMSGMLGKNTKGIAGMASKANLYIAAASLVIDGLAQTFTALSSFTNFLFTGGTRLSDFTEALHKSVSELPIVGGALGLFTGILATVTKTLDGYIESLETASASGASFNNNMMLMRDAAYQTGQSLEQFASTVSANTEKFAQFGTVTEGALKFAKVSNLVRGNLRDLGYSVEEINGTLPTVMSLFSAGASARGQSDQQLAQASQSLMTEMDAMAKLTGKSRKEQADAQAKTMQEAAVRMKMAGMSTDQQKALNEAMIQARAKFGEGGEEMVKLRILGIAPQTEQQRMFAATMGGATKELGNYVDGVSKGTVAIKNSAEMDEMMLDAQDEGLKVMKGFGTNIAVAAAGGVGGLNAMTGTFNTLTQVQLNKQGTMDKEAERARIAKARAEQKSQDEAKKAMTDFQETMMKMKQAMFDNVILPLFAHFKPALTGFAEWAKGGVQSLIQAFKDPSSFINATLLPNLKAFGSFIMDTVVPALAKLGGFIMDYVWPAFKTLGGFIMDYVWPAFKTIGNFLKDNWQPILAGVSAALGYMAAIAIPPLMTALAGMAAGLVAQLAAMLPVIAAFLAANAPIIAIGVGVALLYKGFQMLYDNGWSLSTAFEAIKDNLYSWSLSYTDIWLAIAEKVAKFFGGGEIITAMRKKIADEQEELKVREAARDATRSELAEKRKQEKDKTQGQPATATPATATPATATPATATPATAPSKADGTLAKPLAMTAEKQKNADLLTAELKKKGFNQGQIAAVLGNVAKESGLTAKDENLDYGKTSNERIRSIFGSRATGKTDAELDVIKKDPKQMGEMMYGAGTKVGQGMGNTEPGDGFKYRGRGFIQLTGKNNYAAASKAIFGDNRLVDNPDLASDPAVAAQISAWFTEKQGKGMAKKMGVDLASASQEDLNRVYTSAIAGREIKKGEGGYLGGEVMGKVNAYAQQFGGTAAPATATPVPAASTPATPPSGTVAAAVTSVPPATTAPAPAPAPAPAVTAQTRTPAATSSDSGILSSLRELVELQSKSNRLLNTIAANV